MHSVLFLVSALVLILSIQKANTQDATTTEGDTTTATTPTTAITATTTPAKTTAVTTPSTVATTTPASTTPTSFAAPTSTSHPPINEPTTTEEPSKPDICYESRRRGFGIIKRIRYYYSAENDTCEAFLYKGFGGNRNNFTSRKACEIVCRPGQ